MTVKNTGRRTEYFNGEMAMSGEVPQLNLTHSENGKTVIFRVGEENYGLDIDRVNEIIRVPAITNLPTKMEGVMGVVTLRGQTIPVIDMRTKFSVAIPSSSDTARIIVVSTESGLTGLAVDAVTEVVTINEDEAEETPNMVSIENDFVRAVAKRHNTLVSLIDLDRAIA